MLQPGLQVMSISDLRELCVGKFDLSHNRAEMMAGIEAIVKRLRKAGILGQLWINGSFVTEKIDPNDVDILLYMDIGFFESASAEQKNVISWFVKELRESDQFDPHSSFNAPEGHPEYGIWDFMTAYWKKQYGFSRQTMMKGIAVIELGGDNK